MSVSGIMNYACCCNGGGTITTCPEWANCRPQEIWLSYSFSANYKQIVLPESGATGVGGILREETESFSGNLRLVRTNSPSLLGLRMVDYQGNFTYSKIVELKRLYDTNDSITGLCPSSCNNCVRLVPHSRVQTNGSASWTVPPNLLEQQARIYCNRCVDVNNQSTPFPQSVLEVFQVADYSTTTTFYRCNGSIQSTASVVQPNSSRPFFVRGRPQCLNSTSFSDYHIQAGSVYPFCRVPPATCDSNGNPIYYEGDSINDCYQPFCAQLACYDPFPILVGGCGCSNDPACFNPFPAGPFNNGCAESHIEYTMSSSVNVTNVIP